MSSVTPGHQIELCNLPTGTHYSKDMYSALYYRHYTHTYMKCVWIQATPGSTNAESMLFDSRKLEPTPLKKRKSSSTELVSSKQFLSFILNFTSMFSYLILSYWHNLNFQISYEVIDYETFAILGNHTGPCIKE